MKAPWSQLPLLPAAIGIVAGILLARAGCGLWLVAVGAGAFAWLYYKKRHFWAFFPLMLAVGCVVGITHMPADLPPSFFSDKAECEGRITSCTLEPYGKRCTVDIDRANGLGMHNIKCMAYVQSVNPDVELGAQISFKASLSDLDQTAGMPHEHDFDHLLSLQGYACSAFLNDGDFSITAPAAGIYKASNRMRDSLYDAIVTSPISGSTAAFLLAAIIGDDEYLSQDFTSAFRATGTAHILALSGMHVGVVVSMLTIMLLPLNFMRRSIYARSALTIALVWLYALATDMPPSVVRAATMVSAFLAARLLQRSPNPVNSLCLALIALLVFSPWQLFSPGFQLSFAAVLSILLFMPWLPKELRRKPVLYYVLTAVMVPVAAMLGTGIISAYYFHTFPLTFLVSNVFIGVMFPLILSLGFACMSLTLCGLHVVPLGYVVDVLCQVMQGGIDVIASLGLTLEGLRFSAWALLPYAAAVGFLAVGLRRLINRESWEKPWNACLTATVTAVVATAAVAMLDTDGVPAKELHLPSSKPAAIVLRQGNHALAVSLNKTSDLDLTKTLLDSRHGAFLSSRQCQQGFEVLTGISSLTFAGKLITIVCDNELVPLLDSAHAHYAIIGDGFTGAISDIVEAHRPDTIIISCAVHPSRAKRLMRECQGVVPCRKISGGEHFSLVEI